MLEGMAESQRVELIRFIQSLGSNTKWVQKILTPAAIEAAKHELYAAARDRLIPQANRHADALYDLSRSLWPKGQLTKRADQDLEHVRTLAFFNEMQRLSYRVGLIAYDPDKSDCFKSERALVAEVTTKHFSKEKAALANNPS